VAAAVVVVVLMVAVVFCLHTLPSANNT